jgi:hypothetical protein
LPKLNFSLWQDAHLAAKIGFTLASNVVAATSGEATSRQRIKVVRIEKRILHQFIPATDRKLRMKL